MQSDFFVAGFARRRRVLVLPSVLSFKQSFAGRRTDGFVDAKFKVNE
jgi:hypothetical protein